MTLTSTLLRYLKTETLLLKQLSIFDSTGMILTFQQIQIETIAQLSNQFFLLSTSFFPMNCYECNDNEHWLLKILLAQTETLHNS